MQAAAAHLEVSGDDLVLVHGPWTDIIASRQVKQEDQNQAERHDNDCHSQTCLPKRLTWPASQQAHLECLLCLKLAAVPLQEVAGHMRKQEPAERQLWTVIVTSGSP